MKSPNSTLLLSRLRIFLLLYAAAGVGLLPQSAKAQQSTMEYSIALLGFPVAKADFTTTYNGSNFTITGNIRSWGITEIIGKTRGSTQVSGIVNKGDLSAKSYSVSYTSSGKAREIAVTFNNGNVVSARITPEKKKLPDDWVPLSKAHLKAVLDPITGLVVRPNETLCPRTVPIFDGESRIDLQLTPKRKQRFNMAGVRGQAFVCGVKFIPKGGYRSRHESIEYLQRSNNMEIWFAKNPATELYAPIYVKVPTKIGSVTVSATRFGT